MILSMFVMKKLLLVAFSLRVAPPPPTFMLERSRGVCFPDMMRLGLSPSLKLEPILPETWGRPRPVGRLLSIGLFVPC